MRKTCVTLVPAVAIAWAIAASSAAQTPATKPDPGAKQRPGQSAPKDPAEKQEAAAKRAGGKHVIVLPDQVNWGPAPPALPSGAQAAILDGDPAKPGSFTVRLKMPDGYTVPPHSHPTDEHVTVLSGVLMAGMGDKADDASMHTLNAGAYVKMPRRVNHYVRAKGETILQIQGTGPFQVTYVNADDDPRRKKTD